MHLLKVNPSSFVYYENLGYNGGLRVHVHIDRIGTRVSWSEVTFQMGDNYFDGGQCPAKIGDNWDGALKMVEWWLSGNVRYRANCVMSAHGYSATYCTYSDGCNCEEHSRASDEPSLPTAGLVGRFLPGGHTHGIEGEFAYGRTDNTTWCGQSGLMGTESGMGGEMLLVTCSDCGRAAMGVSGDA